MTRVPLTIYERIGGDETITRIVESFYPRVQKDPLLAPIFPKGDAIRPVMEKQRRFLTQFFGGPPLYSQLYGHPRMRARHLPFPITPRRAEAWLRCMAEALDEAGDPRADPGGDVEPAVHHCCPYGEPTRSAILTADKKMQSHSREVAFCLSGISI